MKALPTQEYLKECFNYDSEAGRLIWKERPENHFRTSRAYKTWNTRFASQHVEPWKDKKGYLSFSVCDGKYRIHRVIWKLIHGNEPDLLDHIDQNPSNNKIDNLRECSRSQNAMNRRMHRDNQSGAKGVYYDPKRNKWLVQIQFNKNRRHIGYFNCPTAARLAYIRAAKEFHGEFASA